MQVDNLQEQLRHARRGTLLAACTIILGLTPLGFMLTYGHGWSMALLLIVGALATAVLILGGKLFDTHLTRWDMAAGQLYLDSQEMKFENLWPEAKPRAEIGHARGNVR